MTTSSHSSTAALTLTLSALLSLPNGHASNAPRNAGPPTFSASLNVTHRALQRCGTLTVTSGWSVAGQPERRPALAHVSVPGGTELRVVLPVNAAAPRDAQLNVTVTCDRTHSVLNVSTRVSRDLPGKALDVDLARSARSVTSLELQNEASSAPAEASSGTWMTEKNRLRQATALALTARP